MRLFPINLRKLIKFCPLTLPALLVGLYGFSAFAQDIRVGVYKFDPYFSVSETGEIDGIWKEMIDQNLHKIGLNPKYETFPPPRLAKNIIKGRTDLTISAHHISVDGHVYYSDLPINIITLNAYHKANRPRIKSFEELAHKSVIVIRGYAYNGKIKYLRDPGNNIKVIEAINHHDAIKRLKKGHADYLLDYAKPMKSTLQKAKVDQDMFISDELSSYPVYYVVSKKTKQGKDLIQHLNLSLKN